MSLKSLKISFYANWVTPPVEEACIIQPEDPEQLLRCDVLPFLITSPVSDCLQLRNNGRNLED